jgi:DNA-directed RNA polymerase specialized sigma24 family protein
MQSAPHSSQASPAPLHGAFRDVHGPTLHGFALLLTLGDRTRAARAAAEALADASDHLGELRHPERAAAWLRSRVIRNLNRHRRGPEPRRSDRLAILHQLDVDEAVMAGLAALGLRERAALVAENIERLGLGDVAVIVGRSEDRLHDLLARARVSYLRAYVAAAGDTPPAGPTIDRVREIAARAMT